ncbi:hypothetical protein DFH27DRAFT_644923 [Peziza echinospora]|nr:hypothetical protein DFH27DRAFT_644923 [Peziza echinospora]
MAIHPRDDCNHHTLLNASAQPPTPASESFQAGVEAHYPHYIVDYRMPPEAYFQRRTDFQNTHVNYETFLRHELEQEEFVAEWFPRPTRRRGWSKKIEPDSTRIKRQTNLPTTKPQDTSIPPTNTTRKAQQTKSQPNNMKALSSCESVPIYLHEDLSEPPTPAMETFQPIRETNHLLIADYRMLSDEYIHRKDAFRNVNANYATFVRREVEQEELGLVVDLFPRMNRQHGTTTNSGYENLRPPAIETAPLAEARFILIAIMIHYLVVGGTLWFILTSVSTTQPQNLFRGGSDGNMLIEKSFAGIILHVYAVFKSVSMYIASISSHKGTTTSSFFAAAPFLLPLFCQSTLIDPPKSKTVTNIFHIQSPPYAHHNNKLHTANDRLYHPANTERPTASSM